MLKKITTTNNKLVDNKLSALTSGYAELNLFGAAVRPHGCLYVIVINFFVWCLIHVTELVLFYFFVYIYLHIFV